MIDISGELTAHCMGPTRIAYCELTDNHDGIYKLTVRPQEPGRHILQIKYGGENVLGENYKPNNCYLLKNFTIALKQNVNYVKYC